MTPIEPRVKISNGKVHTSVPEVLHAEIQDHPAKKAPFEQTEKKSASVEAAGNGSVATIDD